MVSRRLCEVTVSRSAATFPRWSAFVCLAVALLMPTTGLALHTPQRTAHDSGARVVAPRYLATSFDTASATLPGKFRGHDIRAIFDSTRAQCPDKNQYETLAAYTRYRTPGSAA